MITSITSKERPKTRRDCVEGVNCYDFSDYIDFFC